jgi:hypothetical protein
MHPRSNVAEGTYRALPNAHGTAVASGWDPGGRCDPLPAAQADRPRDLEEVHGRRSLPPSVAVLAPRSRIAGGQRRSPNRCRDRRAAIATRNAGVGIERREKGEGGRPGGRLSAGVRA